MKYNKNKIPILIIEGLWGAGKSSLISWIRKEWKVLFIAEPNFQESKIKRQISSWYREQHLQRIKSARKLIKMGETIILERSILSSLAFFYAQKGKLPNWTNSIRKQLSAMEQMSVLFIYDEQKIFLNKTLQIKDRTVKKAIVSNKMFYKNYINFFTKIAPSQLGLNVKAVKIGLNKSQNITIKKYLRNFFNNTKSQTLINETKEYCAAGISYYKNKILLIYSPKHGQYVFPQGHVELGETLKKTIRREMIEETGFTDFTVGKKIYSYKIRYYKQKKIIEKIITCFLVTIVSLRKIKKDFGKNENYKNYFFSKNEAIHKLTWAEDKEAIRLSFLSIKNTSSR